jgi:hypothetical protein
MVINPFFSLAARFVEMMGKRVRDVRIFSEDGFIMEEE